MAHPDAPVFPPAVEEHPVLRLPCPDAEDIRRDAVCWWDVVHDAVRLVCPDRGAILEGRPGQMAWGAGKLAVREPLPVDAVPDQAVRRARHASADAPAERLRPRVSAAAEPYRQASGLSAV
jgi:hypothetical protein